MTDNLLFPSPSSKTEEDGGPLFQPLQIGAFRLSHRVVMAPVGRLWADRVDGTATPQMVHHYARRATPGGLIVAEATAVSREAVAQPGTPGLFTAQQVNAWRTITDAVHKRRGIIVAQLWHAGRLAQPPNGLPPGGPSPIAASGRVFTPAARSAPPTSPREIDENGIDQVIDEFRLAAENASDAGFDGVEMHCANGCLADQFLHSGSNHRTDGYGGSFEKRTNFLIDVVQTLTAVWGADRVGVRLSPFGVINDVADDAPMALFDHVLGRLRTEGIAYLHLMEPAAGAGVEAPPAGLPDVARLLRSHFDRILIASGGFDAPRANALLQEGFADAVSFGRSFIANPDLPSLLAEGAELQAFDADHFWAPPQ
ncbi:alkene reductase [Roseateles sp. P5_E11]